LKATLDCLECIARQALRAARIATDDPVLQRRILEEALARIPEMDLDKSPAVLSLVCYQAASEVTGESDPYRDLKRAQNALALELEPELRDMVAQSDDPLAAALHLAAAGNVIDLGTTHADDIDIRATVEQVMRERFAVDHTDALKKALNGCEDLLYLLDNAGEIVFDKLLIEQLVQRTAVTAVVKRGPIINDVLLEDAEQVGLTHVCPVIDNGGAFVGSPLDLVPPRFLDRMRRADIIIGKGQGNYETVDDFPGNVFLILRAKCEVIAQHMGVRFGQVALISVKARHAARKRSKVKG
jgi:uncharacterized protein with ATP-grasp and redox domains